MKEVLERYGIPAYESFRKSFQALPLGAIIQSVGSVEKIFVVHGGISSTMLRMEEIQALNRRVEPEESSESTVTQLLWNDPQVREGFSPSKRGAWGKQFGPDITKSFLKENKFKLVIRSHEEILEGYRMQHEGLCVTRE
jgi:diadenosine tetraphosphatase ApaH/serine/threonine PP2A family protein phosphatase